MIALLLLITTGCTTSTNTVDITLPPKPERSEIGEVKTLSDFARVLNYYETIVEEWEAWGDSVDGILNDNQNDTKKKKDKEVEKVAEIKNVRIAVSGIYDYAINELPNLCLPLPNAGAPDWVEKKELYKVYRPAHVLAGAVDMFASLPLTHNHPRLPVDGANFRNLAVGWTGEKPWVDYLQESNEVGIRNTVVLYDDEALSAYERGEIQLSPGYNAVFEWQKGTAPDGTEYDIIMKEITGVNHLALLRLGRGGDSAKVLDGAPENNTNASKDHKSNDDWRKEIKESLSALRGLDLPNKSTGIKARLSSEGINKITSAAAIGKSIENGFTSEQHFETVKRISELFQNAKLIKTHSDRKGSPNVQIKRFVAQDKMNSGKDFDALITVKESIEHGHRIYSLELDEINRASRRWTVNDDGTLTPEDKLSTGTPNDTIPQNTIFVKTIFDIVRGSVFDRARAV